MEPPLRRPDSRWLSLATLAILLSSLLTTSAVLPTPSRADEASQSADAQTFAQTGFRVDDAFWDSFQRRGGVRTFGYPVSQAFPFLGCTSQFFQRLVMQQCGSGGVATLNLLDQGLLPYTRVNGSTFPAPDDGLKQRTPRVDSPDYASAMLDFVRANTTDSFEGEPVNFTRTFFDTIDPSVAGTDDPGMLGLLALEIWGAPTSQPQRDPNNASFTYQRFQRGIMHYDRGCQCTQGLLLADELKSLITGQGLPSDLAEQAKDSPLFRSAAGGSPPSGTVYGSAFTPGGGDLALAQLGTSTPAPRQQGDWTPGADALGAPDLRGSLDPQGGSSTARGSTLRVTGWIANLTDSDPPGIGEVRVYDGSIADSHLLGSATLGVSRPDVAQALGNPKLQTAGIQVDLNTTGLAEGAHTLLFAARTRSNGWWWRGLPITVTAAAPRPAGTFAYGAWMANPWSAPLGAQAKLDYAASYVSWRKVEPERGYFLFKNDGSTQPHENDLTNVVAAARTSGLQFMLRLDDVPGWAGGHLYSVSPSDVEDYVYEAVKFAQGTISYVEIFNEANLPREWGRSPVDPARYVDLLHAAYRGAKRADPKVKVVSAAPAQRTGGMGGSMEDVAWLDAFYQAGGKPYFDLLGIHAYLGSFPADADPTTCTPMCFRDVDRYRGIMQKYGDGGKQALITELGTLEQTSVDLGPYAWMELPADKRADYLVSALRLANSSYRWIVGATIFNLDYATTSWVPPTSEQYWFSLLGPGGSPRPAYDRFKQARQNGILP